ncbi:hypothetical protein Ae201684P_007150 [Aphanomyces euteiches]|nr:hypothetical protein Ae201684P_007150 [Aphanomyces euteiches]
MEVQKSKLEGGPLEWKLAVDEYDLKIYKADAAHGRPLHCGVKEIVGSLDDLMALYKTQTTAEAKAHAQRFGRGLADAVNVYSILIGTPEYPHNAIHIKWIALKSAFDGIVSKRDCYSDLEMPIDGKRGWVRAITSLELDCVPDLHDQLGMVRAVHYDMGHVFMESDRPGYLRLISVYDADTRGSVPKWAVRQAVRTWCRNLVDIDKYLREDPRLGGAFCVKRNLGHFGRNRTATNVVFCRKCNRVWDVRVNNIATKAKACNSCSIQGMPIGPVQQVKKLQIVDEDGDLVENESTLYGGASTAVESSEYSDDQSGYSESLAPSSVVFMPPGVLVVE